MFAPHGIGSNHYRLLFNPRDDVLASCGFLGRVLVWAPAPSLGTLADIREASPELWNTADNPFTSGTCASELSTLTAQVDALRAKGSNPDSWMRAHHLLFCAGLDILGGEGACSVAFSTPDYDRLFVGGGQGDVFVVRRGPVPANAPRRNAWRSASITRRIRADQLAPDLVFLQHVVDDLIVLHHGAGEQGNSGAGVWRIPHSHAMEATQVAKLPPSSGGYWEPAVSQDRTLLALTSGSHVQVWHLDKHQHTLNQEIELSLGQDRECVQLAFHPLRNDILAVAQLPALVQVFDLTTATCISQFDDGGEIIASLCFTPVGSAILCSFYQSLILGDYTNGDAVDVFRDTTSFTSFPQDRTSAQTHYATFLSADQALIAPSGFALVQLRHPLLYRDLLTSVLLGMQEPESSLYRFSQHRLFDVNCLGLVFEMVTGKSHHKRWGRQ